MFKEIRVIPVSNLILKKIEAKLENGGDSLIVEDFLKRLETAIRHRFPPYFNDIDLNLATFLDPRFKDIFTGEKYGIEYVSKKLFEEFETLYKKNPEIFMDLSKIEESIKIKKTSTADDDDFWKELENSNMLSGKVEDEALIHEIKLYLLEGKIYKEISPSHFWNKNAKAYPRFSVLARRYLTPLPTSAYSERYFSLSGELISKKRSNLCPEMAEILVFLNNIDLCLLVK